MANIVTGVSYLLPEYTKVAFPGQVFLPQRTYATPPARSLRPSPEDGSETERRDMKREEKHTGHTMHMLPIAYIRVLLPQMRTYKHACIKVARHMYTHT